MAEVAAATQKAQRNWQQFMQTVQRTATIAFAGATAALLGFVRAGLQGTTHGERLNRSMTQLSQQIAAVMLPVVETLTEKIEKLVRWFKSLSGAQQDSIMKWTGVGIAALGVLVVLPKIVAGCTAAATAFKAMGAAAATSGGQMAMAAGQYALVAAAVLEMAHNFDKAKAAGANNQTAATKSAADSYSAAGFGSALGKFGRALTFKPVRKALGIETARDKPDLYAKPDDKARRDVTMAGGQYEDITASFKRLQSTALKTDTAEIPKKQLEEQKITNEQLKALNAKTGNPWVADFVRPFVR